MGFPRQEYWSGLLFPSPGDFPDPGIELTSPVLAGRFFTWETSSLLPYFKGETEGSTLISLYKLILNISKFILFVYVLI